MNPKSGLVSARPPGSLVAAREARVRSYGGVSPAARPGDEPAQRGAARDAVNSQALSPAAIRAFINIARAWDLDEKAQLVLLGAPARTTFYQWKRDPDSARLSADTLERLSYLLGIYKALQILLPDAEAADGWVKRPNQASPFNGRSALDLMLAGQVVDLFKVRSYLDSKRGG